MALLILTLTASAWAAQNVLLLIADDYGADSSSLYNSNGAASLPATPNLTALAQSGVLFRNAYANPVCSPTRACLITGRHSFRTGVGDAIAGPTSPTLRLSEFTLPEAFAANPSWGYQLAQFGKWHLHNGLNSPGTIGGWPHFAGSLGGALANYTNWTKTVDGISIGGYTKYATTDVVDDAIAWIRGRGEAPWFAWVAFNAAHTPWHKPPNALHSHDSLSGSGADVNRNPRPYYEAMIEAMDTEIGRLLSAMDRTNTHVIFLGDNGTPAQVLQPPYPANRGKSTLYDGGTRVPLIISGPSVVQPGRTCEALVHAVDLFATILELAGLDISATVPTNIILDAKSLLPSLQNLPDTRAHAYTELFGDRLANSNDGRALRDEQFKLIRFADERQELYDLISDPYESTNLLAGQLTTTGQAHYYALTMKLGEYQDELALPVILNFTREDGQCSITIEREAGVRYALWRASSPTYLAWAPVNNAIVVTNSLSAVKLTDPDAHAAQYFYRVEASAP